MGLQLNEEQQAAVVANGNLSIIACPGSGKTRVLTSRALYLLKADPASGVLAVTFTKEGVKELENRIKAELGPGAAGRVVVNTFHAHAMEQLRRSRIPYRLISEAARQAIFRRIQREVDGELKDSEIAERIDRYKSTVSPQFEDPIGKTVLSLYTQILKQNGLSDFADVILTAVRGMWSGVVKPLPGNHMLVDEFQDTDAAQYAWITAHGERMPVSVVGDDDQTIYEWRNAMGYNGVVAFERDFAAKRVVLKTNYRCREEVLRHAGLLIQNNEDRVPKELTAAKGPGGDVRSLAFPNRDVEMQEIANVAGRGPEDWAVIARTNRLLDQVEAAFTRAGVPYYRLGGKRLWDRPHVQMYLELLSSLTKGSSFGVDQVLAWLGVSEAELKSLHQASPKGLVEALTKAVPEVDLPKKNAAVLADLQVRFKGWRGAVAAGRPELLASSVGEWLSQQATKDSEKQDLDIASRVLAGLKGTMPQRLAYTRRPQPRNRGEVERTGTALLTLHGAKGLEFKHVWMPSVEEEVLPSKESPVAEERRLCYVGMTRAEDALFMSFSQEKTPSRFLSEAGL